MFALAAACCMTVFPALTTAQTDPGPRNGPSVTGGPVAGLDPNQTQAFLDGQERFNDVEDVPNGGLGPHFNSNSCVSCHSQPAAGGTSPAVNPQTNFANSRNSLPSFITPNGPAREARFINNSNGTPDGSVHALFVITGRSDAPSACKISQENFSNLSNISLRIPTPLFGLGLIEAIPDAYLLNNLNNTARSRASLGIGGSYNVSGNDTTYTRFGWKAQNKSLEIFSGEAYNVEMGISNLMFPNERSMASINDLLNCNKAGTPNDDVNLAGAGLAEFDDVSGFSVFARFLAPPGRGPLTNSVVNGSNVFSNIGCAMCHATTLQTGPSRFAALSNKTIHPYSDFALHHMGPGLADRISQGAAKGDQFRTAPLWGLGERLFLLHDGRTTDLVQAIQAHSSSGNSQFPSSEANRVISNYNSLSFSDKQSLLNFLRSL
jgi:CxxC motif-containing protein (DUF1111 family)